MNKLILTIAVLVLFWSQIIEAQSYFEQNDCWTQASTCVSGCNDGFQIYQYQCFVDKDSIIFGKVFKKIMARYPEDRTQLKYKGSIRIDMKKIFANIVIGSDTINDILLYNFGVEKGDIIDGIPLANTKNHYSSLNSTKSVLNTDSVILLNGVKRKRIYFDNDDTWIEGIGSIKGFFTPAYPIPTGYSYNFLSCFKHNNVELYHNDSCQENCCDLLSGLTAPNIVTKNSVLFPTTTRDYSYITIDNFATSIEIKDVYGKCLKTIENQKALKYSLDFTNYSTGIYFVLVHFADKYEVHKLIRY